MRIQVVETINELKEHFGLFREGVLLENDLDLVGNECDLFGRRRRDAEVLCTLAANAFSHCLDLGTSHGRSAFELASNLTPGARVFTVNLLPEQYDASGGHLITHLLSKEEIGSFYRERGLTNIEQIYANTAAWNVPAEIRDLSVVFVDAAHDTERVYSDTKQIYGRVRTGGFICWHDFSPALRQRFDWINAAMRGVEKFLEECAPEAEVIHLRHSWTGIMRKQEPRAGSIQHRPVSNDSAPLRALLGQALGDGTPVSPAALSEADKIVRDILDSPNAAHFIDRHRHKFPPLLGPLIEFRISLAQEEGSALLAEVLQKILGRIRLGAPGAGKLAGRPPNRSWPPRLRHGART